MDKKVKTKLIGLTLFMVVCLAASFIVLLSDSTESRYVASAVCFINAVIVAYKIIKL